jgi:hypothetical protein
VLYANPGNCRSSQYGLQNPAGQGTFYAGVIAEAQTDINNLTTPRNQLQSAIILVSDGAANATWNTNGPPTSQFTKATLQSVGTNECQAAVSAAQNAANTRNAAGLKTWVYSIAFGASTSTSDCSTDTPRISGCTTMSEIASDLSKFYSDDANGCVSTDHPSITSLKDIFQAVSGDFLTSRLLPTCCLNGATSPCTCTVN